MKKSLAFAGLALICATPALADNTDTKSVTVSGNIIAPLTLALDVPTLTMPTIVKPISGGADNTLAFTCGDTGAKSYVYSAGATPFAHGLGGTGVHASSANIGVSGAQTGTCAELTASGQQNYFFLTTVSAPAATAQGAAVVVNSANCNTVTNGSTVIGATGTKIYCGASVTVTGAATATTYASSFDVTVTYD